MPGRWRALGGGAARRGPPTFCPPTSPSPGAAEQLAAGRGGRRPCRQCGLPGRPGFRISPPRAGAGAEGQPRGADADGPGAVSGDARARCGHLVFVSSLSGKARKPRCSIYNATKFGLRGFALGLRTDLAPQGIGVSLVSPGFMRDAGMFADSGAKPPPGLGTATPDQVAAAVVRAIRR